MVRNTVTTLLRDHDVYIIDGKNARDVPLEAGSFGVEDYVGCLIRFLETVGPGGYRHLARGETAEAEKIKSFYDEYFAVLDLTEEFYIETIGRIFQRAELASGSFTCRGRKVEPKAIRHTALLTVEGGRDDICALGQTAVAQELCSSLRPYLRRHHLQANVGHYGVFSGRRRETEIYPAVRNLILAME